MACDLVAHPLYWNKDIFLLVTAHFRVLFMWTVSNHWAISLGVSLSGFTSFEALVLGKWDKSWLSGEIHASHTQETGSITRNTSTHMYTQVLSQNCVAITNPRLSIIIIIQSLILIIDSGPWANPRPRNWSMWKGIFPCSSDLTRLGDAYKWTC